jgi:hypothetical protein
MSSAWELLFLLLVPGLVGLVLLMGWLEVVLTSQLVADEVARAWNSTECADELEQRVNRIVERVMASAR